MVCSRRMGGVHSPLCNIDYPYTRFAMTNDVRATHPRDCTWPRAFTHPEEVRGILGFEANMTLVSMDEFEDSMSAHARFGTYCPPFKKDKTSHFCVDQGRRTVDGRRLAWLWIFPDGRPGPAHKGMGVPTALWTKQDILDAWNAAHNPTLPVFTRHVEIYSELAITFCLPPR